MPKRLRLVTLSAFLIVTAPALLAMERLQKPLIDEIVAGDHRTAEDRARDPFRHPSETLDFFGLKPGMKVAEIWPGSKGWYLKIIAPTVADKKGGTYYAVVPWDPESDNEKVQATLSAFKTDFVDRPEIYGDVRMSLLRGPDSEIAPAESLDMVLTFRNIHNWMRSDPSTDYSDEYFAAFYKALKPGGILGVVEHRADPDGPADPAAASGYVKEEVVREMAARAGFEFVAKAEINANPQDTRNHPFGVWTLAPTRRSAPRGQSPEPGFDRALYDAIGESDRMTLKFRKPLPPEE